MKEQRFTRWQRIGLRLGLLREESYARRGTDVTGPGFVLGFLGAICGVCVLICLVVLAIAIPIETISCHQGAARKGTTGSFQFPTGCYYRLPDGREIEDDAWNDRGIPPTYKIELGH